MPHKLKLVPPLNKSTPEETEPRAPQGNTNPLTPQTPPELPSLPNEPAPQGGLIPACLLLEVLEEQGIALDKALNPFDRRNEAASPSTPEVKLTPRRDDQLARGDDVVPDKILQRIDAAEQKFADDPKRLSQLAHLRNRVLEDVRLTNAPPSDEIVDRLLSMIERGTLPDRDAVSMSLKDRRVTLPSGRVVGVTVSGPVWSLKTDFSLEAPHTLLLEPLAELDRGYNVHGDLREWFYLTWNDSEDPSAWVLWLASSGSQAGDDIGRTIPVAWCVVRENDDDDGIDERDAALALMTAWIAEVREVSGPDGWYNRHTKVKGSERLTEGTLAKLLFG